MALAARSTATRNAILEAAEELFSAHGFRAASVREIAAAAGVNVGSITYWFESKEALLEEIYTRHCGPMNARRQELIAEARRIADRESRLPAIIRAFIVPAFTSKSDHDGGGARFTRLRAVMSAEGNEAARRIIAQTFDETSHLLVDALHECLPALTRETLVWRCHFLLGALYYTLINPERVTRLSQGQARGENLEEAIEELTAATVASLSAPATPTSQKVKQGG